MTDRPIRTNLLHSPILPRNFKPHLPANVVPNPKREWTLEFSSPPSYNQHRQAFIPVLAIGTGSHCFCTI